MSDPLIVARASEPPNQGSGGRPPSKSLFAIACEHIAELARNWDDLARRMMALEARPLARDGRDGRDGASVTGVRLDDSGHLLVAVGAVENDVGSVVGRPGTAGRDGCGVTAARLDGDDLVLVFSDGHEANVGRVTGRVLVTEPVISGVSVREDGHLLVRTHDGTEFDAGMVRGADGESVQGPPGEPGQSIKGEPGRDGKDADPAVLARLNEETRFIRGMVERSNGEEMTDAEFARRVQVALGRPVQIGDHIAGE